MPLALGIVIGSLTLLRLVDKVLDRIGLGYVDRMPSAWDYIVREPRGTYVRVHLRDGLGMVGGVFGDQSVASLDPKRADLYLQEAWRLDEEGNFVDAILDSRGVWIAHDVLVYVEFLKEESDAGEPHQARPGPDDEQSRRGPGHGQTSGSTQDEPGSLAS